MSIYLYIGYLLGTYLGVYFKISSLFLVFILLLLFVFKIFCELFLNHIRIQIFNKKYLVKTIVIILMIILAILRINKLNLFRAEVFEIDNLNKVNNQTLGYIVKIINKTNSEYSNIYIGKILKSKTKCFKNIKVVFKTKEDLSIASTYKILGNIEKFREETNYKGFNERKYYYSRGIDYRLELKKKINSEKNTDIIERINSKFNLIDYILLLKKYFYTKVDKFLVNSSVFKALFLGNSSELEEELKIDFKVTNVYHILAMSGMHISYLVLLLNLIFKTINIKINFKLKKLIQVTILIMYMLIIGMSTSISRAVFLVLIILIFKEFNIKYGFLNSILASLFFIFIINPYIVYDISLYLSYVSAISIYFFLQIEKNLKIYTKLTHYIKGLKRKLNKNKNKVTNKKKNKTINQNKNKSKSVSINNIDRFKKIIINYFDKFFRFIFFNIYISITVYISLLPLLIYFFNEITFNFIIANLLISFLLPVLMLLGFIFIFLILFLDIFSYFSLIITNFLNNNLIIKLVKLIDLLLDLLLLIVNKVSNLNNNFKFVYYLRSPSYLFLLTFYLMLYVIFYIFARNTSEFYSASKYVKNKFIELKGLVRKKKLFSILIILIFIFSNLFSNFFINSDKYKVSFVSVGQGDSSFIITRENTTILVDAGSNIHFDNGKELRRYILARRKKKIDHLFISHFDIDHIGGAYTLIDSDMVKLIYIPKYVGNFLETEILRKYKVINTDVIQKIEENVQQKKDIIEADFLNYYYLIKKAKEKNINIIELKRGDMFFLDRYTNVEVLFPIKELININFSNNNSLVFKLNCITNNKSNKDNQNNQNYQKNLKFSILYTGDIEKEAINRLLKLDNLITNNKDQRYLNLKSDILKVPHHGSKNSFNEEFLRRINPSISIISAGKNNIYGHPHKEVLNFFYVLKSKVFRTDILGEIFLEENTILSY